MEPEILFDEMEGDGDGPGGPQVGGDVGLGS